MIEFPCPCGQFKFSLQDDMAGGLVQCPRCRRLNDVPTHEQMLELDDTGVYKLDEPPPVPDTEKIVRSATRAFTRDRVDADGYEIDLRTTSDDVRRAHSIERVEPTEAGGAYDLKDEAEPDKDRPKYDPETGELIRPLDIKPDLNAPPKIDPRAVPMASRAMPVEVQDEDHPGPWDALLIPAKLLRPINVIVMSLIFFCHVFSQLMIGLVAWGFWLIAFFFLIAQALFLSHYGNVVDEIGPTGRNELPTPLRSVNWHDDTWGPFWRMILSLTICYGPSIATLMRTRIPVEIRLIVAAVFGALGTAMFPAVLLTAQTSGTWLNLRLDRLWGVVKVCGAEYALPLILWIVCLPLYFYGANMLYLLTFAHSQGMFFDAVGLSPGLARALRNASSGYVWLIAYGMLIGGIFLMHWFCWSLGLLYRRHHPRFPWLYQRHDRKARDGMPPPAAGFAVQPTRPKPAPRAVPARPKPIRPPRLPK